MNTNEANVFRVGAFIKLGAGKRNNTRLQTNAMLESPVLQAAFSTTM
jgi:hypothetical protein